MKIIGKITYQSIETGFWGLIDNDGNQWEIIDIPNQLKYPNKKVEIEAEELDIVTTSMWGIPIKIISFSTLMP